MTPAQRNAWLAALIDGEGSIMLNKRTYSGRQRNIRRRQMHFRAVVSICNTDIRLMEALEKQTGVGRTYQHRNNSSPNTPRKRASWTWRLVNDEIRVWLPRVRPYLFLKGDRSDLLLEALDIKRQITPGNVGFLPCNREPLIARLYEIYYEIRNLNTRGRSTLTQKDIDNARQFQEKRKSVIYSGGASRK